MIETGLVYIHSIKPTKRFVGCGALIEGDLVATCRHVWRGATRAAAEPLEVEIEYPRSRESRASARSPGVLADACEDLVDPAPDLVLLEPTQIPSDVLPLQLAAQDKFETGSGYVQLGLQGKISKIVKPGARLSQREKSTLT